jgi:hypothetical protein
VRTLDVSPVAPSQPAIADEAAWFPDWYSPRLVRVPAVGPLNPRTVPLPVRRKAGVWIVAAGAGYVWATTPRDGSIWRIDTATNKATRVPVPHVPTGLAVVEDGVWVSVRQT